MDRYLILYCGKLLFVSPKVVGKIDFRYPLMSCNFSEYSFGNFEVSIIFFFDSVYRFMVIGIDFNVITNLVNFSLYFETLIRVFFLQFFSPSHRIFVSPFSSPLGVFGFLDGLWQGAPRDIGAIRQELICEPAVQHEPFGFGEEFRSLEEH